MFKNRSAAKKKKARRAARKARQTGKRSLTVKDSQCRKIPGSEFSTPEGLDAYRCTDPQHTHHTIRTQSGEELAAFFSGADTGETVGEVKPQSLRKLTEAQHPPFSIPMVGDEDLAKLWGEASDEERVVYCTGLALRVRNCPDAPYSRTVRELHLQMAMHGAELTWEECLGVAGVCTHASLSSLPAAEVSARVQSGMARAITWCVMRLGGCS